MRPNYTASLVQRASTPLTNPKFAYSCRRFTGIEFAVVHAQPPAFFIIHKRERLSPDEGTSFHPTDSIISH